MAPEGGEPQHARVHCLPRRQLAIADEVVCETMFRKRWPVSTLCSGRARCSLKVRRLAIRLVRRCCGGDGKEKTSRVFTTQRHRTGSDISLACDEVCVCSVLFYLLGFTMMKFGRAGRPATRHTNVICDETNQSRRKHDDVRIQPPLEVWSRPPPKHPCDLVTETVSGLLVGFNLFGFAIETGNYGQRAGRHHKMHSISPNPTISGHVRRCPKTSGPGMCPLGNLVTKTVFGFVRIRCTPWEARDGGPAVHTKFTLFETNPNTSEHI